MAKKLPPNIPRPKLQNKQPLGLLELDRFSHSDLQEWEKLSKDLDELEDTMHFSLEPERRRFRQELIQALQLQEPKSLEILDWVRIVDYRFSLTPLSSAGSLLEYGGRFNAGIDLNPGTLNPWPALYLAEDYETAYREKFQIKSNDLTNGLKPEELALEHGKSHTTVFLSGRLDGVFDMTSASKLDDVAKTLKKIKMPQRAHTLMKKLGMNTSDYKMVKNGQGLYDAVLRHNYRILPVQFGLPARGQVLGELIKAAGFEAILYKSTAGPGNCLAIFPDQLSEQSYVELIDVPPEGVKYSRLDSDSAGYLAGWQFIRTRTNQV